MVREIYVMGSIRPAIIDDKYYEECNKHKWYITESGYARNGESIYLHKFIAELAGMNVTNRIDHKNWDTLDDREENLRSATDPEDCAHKRQQSNNISGFKGVFWQKHAKKWRV